MTRDVILLLLRCLSNEPEFCVAASEVVRDNQALRPLVEEVEQAYRLKEPPQ